MTASNDSPLEAGCGVPTGTPVMIATPISTGLGCVAGCRRRVTGRPLIALANTTSDLTPCNAHLI